MLKPVSGHHVLLYSEDGRKMKMKVVSQQKVIEYSGYCSRFYRLFFSFSPKSNGFVVTSVMKAEKLIRKASLGSV